MLQLQYLKMPSLFGICLFFLVKVKVIKKLFQCFLHSYLLLWLKNKIYYLKRYPGPWCITKNWKNVKNIVLKGNRVLLLPGSSVKFFPNVTTVLLYLYLGLWPRPKWVGYRLNGLLKTGFTTNRFHSVWVTSKMGRPGLKPGKFFQNGLENTRVKICIFTSSSSQMICFLEWRLFQVFQRCSEMSFH